MKRKLKEEQHKDIHEIKEEINKEEEEEENSSFHSTLLFEQPPQKQIKSQTTVIDNDISNIEIDNSLFKIGKDCLIIILNYLEMEELNNLLFLSKEWSTIAIPTFIEMTNEILLNNYHLIDFNNKMKQLFKEYEEDENNIKIINNNNDPSGFYSEYAHWKINLNDYSENHSENNDLEYCEEMNEEMNEDSFEEDDNIVKDDNYIVKKEGMTDIVNNNSGDKNIVIDKILPFGSPLCKNTILDQYKLIEEDLTPNEYKNLIKKHLNIELKDLIIENPFIFYNQIKYEQEQATLYLNEIFNSIKKTFKLYQEYEDEVIDYNDEEEAKEQALDNDFHFSTLNFSIIQLLRRAGVKFFEPQIICDSLIYLKNYIHTIISFAYNKKFKNHKKPLKFKEPKSLYNTYWGEDIDHFLTYDDLMDSDLKLNSNDIKDAVKEVTDKKLIYSDDNFVTNYLKDDYRDEEYVKKYNEFWKKREESLNWSKQLDDDKDDENSENSSSEDEMDSDIEEESPKVIEELIENLKEEEEEEKSIITKEIKEEESMITTTTIEEEEEGENNLINQSTKKEEEEEIIEENDSFIDDSDLFNEMNIIKDSLEDELLKVSIRVHEEIYGKEKTHQEKLYLKNWFGNGPLFYSHCASSTLGNDNPLTFTTNEIKEEQDILNEEEQVIIERDKKEDIEYFGYSLYEDEEDEFPEILEEEEGEYANEEESKEYHLRRLLREESFKCIFNYFKRDKDTNDNKEEGEEIK